MLVLPKVLSIVFLIKGIRIYKVFISLLQQTKLCVKHELEIEGVWKNIKHMLTSMILNFGLTNVY